MKWTASRGSAKHGRHTETDKTEPAENKRVSGKSDVPGSGEARLQNKRGPGTISQVSDKEAASA